MTYNFFKSCFFIFLFVLLTISLWGQENDSMRVHFSHPSGFYDNNFNLTIEGEYGDGRLVYTLDGSNPNTSSTAQMGTSPITVEVNPDLTSNRAATPCFIVRASALDGDTDVTFPVTRTFIFLDKVKQQKNPGGDWPKENLSNDDFQYIDYAMDPDVVNSSTYRNKIDDALKAIPSLSIATNNEHLFDQTTGIYVNAYGQGKEWERDCSVELIHADGSEGFSINGGLRIRGGWSRHDYFPKHALRLFFRDEYGKGKLKFPLFDEEGVDEFDKVDLRCANNYSWANNSSSSHNTFIREVFTRDSQNAAGRPYTRSRYYHLYLNGMYWGIYQTQERSEARFAESYFGGDKEEYDVVKISGEDYSKEIAATDGTLDKWEEIYNLSKKNFRTNKKYFHLEGKDENGVRIPHAEVLVDVDNLIDFMINIIYTGNYDSPVSAWGGNKKPNNFYAITNREDKRFGFKFFVHDGEHVLMTGKSSGPGIGIQENRADIGYRNGDDKMVVTDFSMFHSQWLHHKLCENEEYRKRFADRAWFQLTGDGIFTGDKCEERLNNRAEQIETAIIAESARWGDTHTSKPYTRDNDWVPEVNDIRNNYFPYRTEIVIDQLKEVGLFGDIEAPLIRYAGHEVLSKSLALYASNEVEIENPDSEGVVYYTLNGKDPREIGDGLSASARKARNNHDLTLNSSTTIKARIFKDGEWGALNEVTFLKKQTDFSRLKITEIHYHPVDSISGSDTINDKSYEFIEFKNTGYDESINLSGMVIDSAISYQFPDGAILYPQEYFVVASKPSKFFDRYGIESSANYKKNLGNAGERIVVINAQGESIIDFTYDDAYPWATEADGKGWSLESVSDNPEGDPADPEYWTSSEYYHGTPFGHSLLKTSVKAYDDIVQNSISIYPNPVEQFIYVDLGAYYANIDLKIYSVDGREMVNLEYNDSDFVTADLSILNPGAYILKLRTDQAIQSFSLIRK